MKKFILFVLINVLPIAIIGWYLYENIGGAESLNEVIENSPFKEFTYIDHDVIMNNKENIRNINGIYKDLLIFINGVYISSDGNTVGIKVPMAFIFKYIKIDDYKYYNGCIIKGNGNLGKATPNDLTVLIPQNFKDIVIYNRDSVIAGVITNNETVYVWVFRKKGNITAETIKLYFENIKKHNPDLIEYKVIDFKDKFYVYLRYRGHYLELNKLT
ncbi:VAR1 protein isolog [Methanocaldococcus lauensis]|uniref:VAR1 protein isolog n=1 Tax=Methanocaldococcus lauensis TaxID=2546128 RepID=A0A8D6PU65_9EURY|nr:VAR1 protein isolog [Methanocaldococcus lauensis]CAB3288063.1 VAR1 protein isolog [Methanocaldococcus lauensis]